ncbi:MULTISPECIES: pantoate--beta-alanine ligase [unclassified Planococcus (in: firmicutes)]|uniref:pantoate--beta-alanine ligase n=1 Tax=unclassified Planococcus (in: firmicutes) TaxID=2662419 RepID=UPI000C34B9ED|nr:MULTISPECIES: pantoate--beta-alanine ligase [unclassified Planococcus (in: firmicutes)]AUD13992.1 pantoate--beta-alanine ligase [Planococcus sp. MB-3u-03]PKG47987.1 pantoate--beta-alanine ligase [Planococcus sp. Urea-trap-24]PKG91835.1 pantoate--beta-alanine ligase [Planococcus sp. Urea-3u-39]PKH43261.1 pantoate--beta-alanine ligase [Planococcus sp. MB-3u-09]
MQVVNTVKDLRNWVLGTKKSGQSIGLVPTMGFLHEGHLALVESAKAESDLVVMSIFVNPAQFGPNEDFDRYPRDFERDSLLAEKAGVDVIFAPSVEEMYPRESQITMGAGTLADVLCGKSRPGHFDGVLKVVTKLFHLVQPDTAYFGQKDAQQLAIIESLVRDFDFPLEIRRIETVREQDGLAKSSRNVYLSETERSEAPKLYQALQQGVIGARNGKDPIPEMTRFIQSETSGRIDYVKLLSYPDLTDAPNGQAILALAVQFQKARLIDNIIFNLKEN